MWWNKSISCELVKLLLFLNYDLLDSFLIDLDLALKISSISYLICQLFMKSKIEGCMLIITQNYH